MNRREFIQNLTIRTAAASALGVAVACTPQAQQAVPTPEAVAQDSSLPELNWDMPTSWPVALDTIFGGATAFADAVGALSGGKFKITPRPAGEVAPGTEVLNVVSEGAFPIGHTASYYYVGKSPVTAFGTALPFGLNAQQQNAWLYEGGGLQLLQEAYAKKFNVIQWPAGNTGVQMGGWFRKEIKSLADLKGLKMRIPGIGGQIMAKLGAVPQTLAGTDIYPALERGALDAAEWVGPYDDEKLGFHKIAKNYYYPGWWEGGPQLSFYVNLAKWNELPEAYRAAFETACAEANVNMLAEYDTKNPQALQRLVKQGVKLRAFPKDVMDAARAATYAMYEEEARKNPAFARIYKEWKAFLDQGNQWFKVAEASYANYLFYAK